MTNRGLSVRRRDLRTLPVSIARSAAPRYVVAVVTAVSALLVRLALDPYLHANLPYVTFFVAMTLVAWLGGPGPALLCSALSFLLAQWFLAPANAFWTTIGLVGAVAYFMVALLIAFISQSMHGAHESAVARQEELEREVSEHRKTEESLRDMQAELVRRNAEIQRAMDAQGHEKRRFQDVLNHLPVCVALLTPDHRVAFANRMFRERFGESDAGCHCFEHIFHRLAPCEFCETYRVLETRESHQWEMAGPNGSVYRVFDFPFTDTDGSTLILEVNLDITESKRAQAKLAEQAALLQLAHDAIIVKDLHGKILLWNRGAEEMYGWRSDEVVDGNIYQLLQTTFPIPLPEIMAIVRERGQWEGELTHVTRGGQTVIEASRWSLQRDPEGKPCADLEINRDITAHVRAEEALRINQQRLAFALKAGHSGAFDWDIKSNINAWSPEMEELYGVAPGTFGGRYESWEELLLPEDLETARAATQESLRTGEFASEWRVRRPNDGQIRWLAARAKVFFDNSGRPSRMLGINVDITERKQAEHALAQRTAELARSNAELEQFAYVASHDLQEPLRMVANFTQLLADRYSDKLDQDARDFIGYAVEGAARMQTLIRDLLALSRVGTRGKDFEVVRAGEALRRAAANLEFAIRETGAVLSHDELPAVLADSSQMTQLFQNLIGNAVKFKSVEPPRVHISAVRSGREWTFSVSDNGIGFEPQYAERIFKVFQRLHTRDDYAGTGMGLAICRKIVERHHGRIWAESTPGSGATFYFTIPAAGVPAVTRESRGHAA